MGIKLIQEWYLYFLIMQRIIVYGVPYLVDTLNRVFVCDGSTEPREIGTYGDGHVIIHESAKPGLKESAEVWREGQVARTRKSTQES